MILLVGLRNDLLEPGDEDPVGADLVPLVRLLEEQAAQLQKPLGRKKPLKAAAAAGSG